MSFDTRSSLKVIVADLKIYVEKKIELATLEAQDKGAVLAAAVLSNVLGIALLLIGGFLLLFAAAIGLGYFFDNMALGFLALAFVFLVMGVYIYKTKRNLLKNRLERQISLFIQNTFENAGETSSTDPASPAPLKSVREEEHHQAAS
ncbi:MAG: phage holin family protein [Cyclonatronaceae bacterium]